MKKFIRSDIYFDNEGKLDIDYQNDNHGGTTIKRGKNKKEDPYLSTNDSFLNGHEVYSVYAFTGDNYVDIFKEIKKGGMDPDMYLEWLDHTARYIWEHIMFPNKPDIIAIPESSSSLVIDLARRIHRISNIDYLPHAFKKNPVEDITLELPEGKEFSETSLRKLQRLLDHFKETGKFEAKAVPKRWLKFFRNIYTNDDRYADILRGKTVAVLDDSMSSKVTMANIFDVCDYLYEVATSYGITIFKKVGHR